VYWSIYRVFYNLLAKFQELWLWLLLTDVLLLFTTMIHSRRNTTEKFWDHAGQALVCPFLFVHHGVKFSMPTSVLHQPS
jgi:hypothetical protein